VRWTGDERKGSMKGAANGLLLSCWSRSMMCGQGKLVTKKRRSGPPTRISTTAARLYLNTPGSALVAVAGPGGGFVARVAAAGDGDIGGICISPRWLSFFHFRSRSALPGVRPRCVRPRCVRRYGGVGGGPWEANRETPGRLTGKPLGGRPNNPWEANRETPGRLTGNGVAKACKTNVFGGLAALALISLGFFYSSLLGRA
jgi:hypothetical protein